MVISFRLVFTFITLNGQNAYTITGNHKAICRSNARLTLVLPTYLQNSDKTSTLDFLGANWSHICLSRALNHNALWHIVFLHFTNILTYSLTDKFTRHKKGYILLAYPVVNKLVVNWGPNFRKTFKIILGFS